MVLMRENTIIIEKLKGVELQIRYKYKSVYEDIWVHQKLFLNIQKSLHCYGVSSEGYIP